MLYEIIAVFDPIPIFKRCRIRMPACDAASGANSGPTVEYALTSRALLFHHLMILPAAFSPNGWSMAGDEASLEVTPCGNPARQFHTATLLLQKSLQTMTNMEQDRWSRVKGRLRSSVGEDVYTSWFARMDLESVQQESVHLSVPTRFLKSWIQAHYAERVLTCWQAEMPEVHRIDLTVRTAMRCAAPAKEASAPIDQRRAERSDGRPAPELRATAIAPVSASHDALGGSPLDPRLTFGSFVIGRSNTLAHAAARQVAEGRRGDPVMFNPLYIHAGVGLGKTHLLQAVTWAGNSGSERKVLYLTAEKFMYGFVAALKTQTALAFKEALRGIDVLVIDDLQFLQGKSTQAEFCHTLNALIDAGTPGGDRGRPSAVRSGEPRRPRALASGRRAGGRDGLARRGTARSRSSNRASPPRARIMPSFDVPAPVLDYVARTITHNGRDLEGAVNRLLAHQQAQRPAGDAGNGGARGARPDPSAGARSGSRSRTSSGWSPGSTMSAAPTCCRRAAPPMWCARARSRCIWQRR